MLIFLNALEIQIFCKNLIKLLRVQIIQTFIELHICIRTLVFSLGVLLSLGIGILDNYAVVY